MSQNFHPTFKIGFEKQWANELLIKRFSKKDQTHGFVPLWETLQITLIIIIIFQGFESHWVGDIFSWNKRKWNENAFRMQEANELMGLKVHHDGVKLANFLEWWSAIAWVCEIETKGRFTLWPKVERPLISTNQIARNHGFGLSTLHTRGQSPKAVALQNAYMATLFDQGEGLSKGSLGQTGMETQTMVERPSISFHKKWKLYFIAYFQ